MNVTIKIADELGRQARHCAVDAGLSLSGWIAKLVGKELSRSDLKKPQTLLEALGNERLAETDLVFPRDQSAGRAVDFS